MTRPRRQPAPRADDPFEERDWWPLGMSLDAWRASRTAAGEVPLYWTEARERAAREHGKGAGLVYRPMEHEVDLEEWEARER